MAAGYGIEAAVLVSAQSIANGAIEIAAELAEADRLDAATREQRQQERAQMRDARQAGTEKRRLQAEVHAARQHRLQEILAISAPPAGAADTESIEAAGAVSQEQLAAYLAQLRQAGGIDIIAARQALAAHALDRLQLAAGETLPTALEQLAIALVQAPEQERAEALATELRLQVQRHNEARAAAAEAARLQAAAAFVLEQSLKDLGYAVEEIAETLFVEGGIAHFQRPEWGDYFVRLRIDPKRQAMNFNVVRAGTTGEDRAQEDMRAEERWCSEFPKIFETLKARGIPIAVTRLLQAGEAPIQVVDATSLPVRTAEDLRQETLKVRSLP
jgi:hypothetical protein